jgi:hypothetical protein
MSDVTTTNVKLCVVQWLITEGLSSCYFALGHSVSLDSIGTGLYAPIVLALPLYTFQYSSYVFGPLQELLVNAVFAPIMWFSIAKNHRLIGAFCLFLYNLAGIWSLALGVS